MYHVQIGAFSSTMDNQLYARYKAAIPVEIEVVKHPNGQLNVYRTIGISDKQEALAIKQKLMNAGVKDPFIITLKNGVKIR